MARHFRRAFGTSPDRTHELTGCDRDPSNGRAYCRSRSQSGIKDNSVVAEKIDWRLRPQGSRRDDFRRPSESPLLKPRKGVPMSNNPKTQIARLDDIERRGRDIPVREHFGIRAFGINAFTPGEDGTLVGEHDESGSGQEELYLVLDGK